MQQLLLPDTLVPALRPSSGQEAFQRTRAPGRVEQPGVALIHQPLQLLQTAAEAAQRSRHVYTTAQQRPSGQNRWKSLYILIYTVWRALTQTVQCSGRGWNWHIYDASWNEVALLSIHFCLWGIWPLCIIWPVNERHDQPHAIRGSGQSLWYSL